MSSSRPPRSSLRNEFLQAVCFRTRLGEESIPIVRGLATFQHFAEYPICVIPVFVGALGILIIDPGVNDKLGSRVIPEEQAVLLEELGTKPVLVIISEGIALAVVRPRRILRDHLERELGDCGKTVVRNISRRRHRGLGGRRDRLNLA